MSDYNSSLPIRTETAGDVAVKIVDTLGVNQLVVEADGSVNVNATISATDLDIRDLVFATDKVDVSGSVVALDAGTLAALESITVTATNLDIRDLVFATDKVDTSGSVVALDAGTLAALESITVSATDLDIRNLVFATDKADVSGSSVALDAGTLAALESITVQNGSGASAVNIQDGGNSITVDGTVELGATSLAALESITVQNASGASAVNIQDGGNSITVDANNLDIRDLVHTADSVRIGNGTANFLAINADGSINVVPQEDAGTETVDYLTSSAVAAAASVNHDFLVTTGGKLFQVASSASGKAKVEVQVETGSATNTFTSIGVQFNSTANPNMNFSLSKYRVVPTGARVRVIRTNKDNQAQDLYSTIVLLAN